MIGAVVDISTILTTTVASLPSNYMAYSNQTIARETILARMKIKRGTMTFNTNATIGSCSNTPFVTLDPPSANQMNQHSDEEILDMIMPKYNSVF